MITQTVNEIRQMTRAEILMARALGSCQQIKHSRHKGRFRALHATALSERQVISTEHASMLRAGVRSMASYLAPEVVDLAAGDA